MSDATPEHEREARRQQRDFERIENAAAATVFLLGSTEAGSLSVYLAIAGGIGFAARDRAIVMGHIANDPPDAAYRTPARMRRRARISFSEVVDEPVASAADEVIDGLSLGSAALRAMLRAHERELAARQANDVEAAARRHEEALRYAERGAQENRRYAEMAPELAQHFSGVAPPLDTDFKPRVAGDQEQPLMDMPSRRRGPAVTLREALSDPTLAMMYRAGVPAYFLSTALTANLEDDGLSGLARRLELSARNARRYSRYLERTILRELEA